MMQVDWLSTFMIFVDPVTMMDHQRIETNAWLNSASDARMES